MLARKPWGHPENTKGVMGVHCTRSSGPSNQHSLRTGRTSEAFCLRAEKHLSHSQCASAKCQDVRGALRFYTFSFSDARKAHNRLRWIGKTRKMAGISGNAFNGSFRVHQSTALRRRGNKKNQTNCSVSSRISIFGLKMCFERVLFGLIAGSQPNSSVSGERRSVEV